MNHVIELTQVSKKFKDKQAVNNISFQIPQGSITAILGPNGAGKTTTLSMMLGLMEPTSGKVNILGHTPSSPLVREKIGVMLQEVSVMDSLRIHELLTLVRSYYHNPLSMEQLIKLTRFSQTDLNRFTDKLSGGQKRSLNFALALAGNPDILFFDEPTVGLDTTARRHFWEDTRKLASQGKTIIFSTHYLQEADDAADRILLFNQGKIVADDTPANIKAKLMQRTVSFLPQQINNDELYAQLEALFSDDGYHEQQGRIVIPTQNSDDLLRCIFKHELPVYDIQINEGRLDEAFEQLTIEPRGEQ
ncbi:ABC-2 type transport system ATP-binding protein [Paenibacillus turicensis]|uniref:ABC-2 type transport system ATP-binding protein n=1 Tax=Paenibacillus turicensis TaxID=160487 RepID=A0ABS4FVK3_9BACL|nr:ABC transporter ATP-binding protein [Paenibacillus turicensis]MBP1906565.1 ABC-2 type transport system ATP-binding protein [Paenibacillus turicensis]